MSAQTSTRRPGFGGIFLLRAADNMVAEAGIAAGTATTMGWADIVVIPLLWNDKANVFFATNLDVMGGRQRATRQPTSPSAASAGTATLQTCGAS